MKQVATFAGKGQLHFSNGERRTVNYALVITQEIVDDNPTVIAIAGRVRPVYLGGDGLVLQKACG